jgi:hypothetical protein
MRDVNSTLVFAAVVIAGYVVMVMISGCSQAGSGPTRSHHITCYSAGQAILDTEAFNLESASNGWHFTESHTGKKFWITGDCVVAEEKLR